MKTTIIFAILLSATQLTTVQAKSTLPLTISQSKPTAVAFSFLRGHTAGKGYSLQWSMVSNTGIESFEVQSTYEDPYDTYSNWETLDNVMNTNQKIFKFTDLAPMQGIISYRIIAVLSENKGTVSSDIFTTTIQ